LFTIVVPYSVVLTAIAATSSALELAQPPPAVEATTGVKVVIVGILCIGTAKAQFALTVWEGEEVGADAIKLPKAEPPAEGAVGTGKVFW
jgi:hypothetical protein